MYATDAVGYPRPEPVYYVGSLGLVCPSNSQDSKTCQRQERRWGVDIRTNVSARYMGTIHDRVRVSMVGRTRRL